MRSRGMGIDTRSGTLILPYLKFHRSSWILVFDAADRSPSDHWCSNGFSHLALTCQHCHTLGIGIRWVDAALHAHESLADRGLYLLSIFVYLPLCHLLGCAVFAVTLVGCPLWRGQLHMDFCDARCRGDWHSRRFPLCHDEFDGPALLSARQCQGL